MRNEFNLIDAEKNNDKNGEIKKDIDLRMIPFGRGFLIIADINDTEEHTKWGITWIHYKTAVTLRRWGTTQGLGEIGANGLTEDSILDGIPKDLWVPSGAIHGMWNIAESQFENVMKEIEKAELRILKGK
jgi:hypothetical protein